MKAITLILSLIICRLGFSQVDNNSLIKDDSVNLYVFIGEKISLIKFDPNKDLEKNGRLQIDSVSGDTMVFKGYVVDNAFDAKYKVVGSVFNDLKVDTIDFKVYDHYGRPAFEKYQTVLLYISKSKEGDHFFHQKYMFDVLIKDKNGNWRGKNGESIKELFDLKKNSVLKARGIF